MNSLKHLSRWIANAVGLLGAIGVIVMMLHITTDVLCRVFLGSPLVGTNEIVSRYYMIAVAFLPLAWVEHRNGMISVELFDAFMSRGARLVGDLLVAIVSIAALLLITWTSWHEAVAAFQKDAFVMAVGSRIPVWPTYFMIPVGCFLAAVLVVLRAVTMVISPLSIHTSEGGKL
ncbi:MAG TPA: TRAP transporter small permease [Hyphomonas sp.]|nr:TRAP transporter small permease [Hyphomonas sp.]|tara:strand:+ start:24610 stop:25131 length:522 start_codon:yes stop_codon:yes gene_type:complete